MVAQLSPAPSDSLSPLADHIHNLGSFSLESLWEQIISVNVMNDEGGQYLCAVVSFLIVGTWDGAGQKGLMTQMHELGFGGLSREQERLRGFGKTDI